MRARVEFRVPSIPAHWLLPQFKGGVLNIQHRAGMLALLILNLVLPGQLTAQSQQGSGAGMNQTEVQSQVFMTSTFWLVTGRLIIES